MPGMDGAQLLNEVMQRYPKIIRFILSGYSDRETILKSIGPTHQYLTKPCDSETLKNHLKRAFRLRGVLEDSKLRRLVSEVQILPSMPSLYFEIMKELQSPEASLKSLGEIISKDLGMSAKILQLVNSAFFGLPRHIESISQAVGLLGLDTIRPLVLTAHIFSQYDQEAVKALSLELLWGHSLLVANVAKEIAQREVAEKKLLDDVYMAGMLHDVGKLILACNLPDLYNEVFFLKREESIPLFEAESRVFNATHAHVGAYLLGLWGLPDPIVEAVAFHHEPATSAERSFSSLAAVHVADALAYEFSSEPGGTPDGSVDLDYLEEIGMGLKLPLWRDVLKSNLEAGDS